jgi:hypothetical protein
MRRQERAITDKAELDAVVAQATVVTVAMVDNGRPYVVPMNFGYAAIRVPAGIVGQDMRFSRCDRSDDRQEGKRRRMKLRQISTEETTLFCQS